jgi:beta-1,4-N-acetylglucosaminyltransferase
MTELKREGRTIFVTVGTTLFERLVESVTTPEALDWMEQNGYTRLIVQYGRGRKPSIIDPYKQKRKKRIEVELYDFKPSLLQDMTHADLILSHAGAGTVSEVLQQEKKRLVVVVNTLLMDNHQLELAHAMHRRNYLYVVESPDGLSDFSVWDDFERYQPKPPDPTDPQSFAKILGSFFGHDADPGDETAVSKVEPQSN